MSIMDKFTNPDLIKSMPFDEKVGASIITVILGMGITFSSLVALYFFIIFMTKITKKIMDKKIEKNTSQVSSLNKKEKMSTNEIIDERIDNNIKAIITGVIASHLEVSADKLEIKTIKKIGETEDEEVIAAITAALVNFTGKKNIKIKSVKCLNNSLSHWGITGRLEQIDNKL